ncbi:MAG TPA: helix-turn-helix domain-containing protein [archaeon]|jgi:HTH-type transcriptional regulator, sugar sensing transcriptional regulator|nr:helix-turn-helix domain-containing protein [archaeon]
MPQDIIFKLQEIGLSKNESTIYLELLSNGEASANELSKKINFDRTLCYQLLNKLIEKGLVHCYIKKSKKIFNITDTKDLLLSIRKKEQIAEELIDKLNLLKTKSSHEEQNLLIYQGDKGIDAVFTELLKAKEVYIFGGAAKTFNKKKMNEKLISKLNKLKIKGKAIISDPKSYSELGFNIKELMVRELKGMNNTVTTIIYGNKIGIHILADNPIVIFIDNKTVAKSYLEHFKNLWNQAKPLTI